MHSQQTSILRVEKQNRVAQDVRIRMLQKVIPSLDRELLSFDLSIHNLKRQFILKKLKGKINLLSSLVIVNDEKAVYDKIFFSEFINQEKKNLFNLYKEKSELYSLLNLFSVLIQFPVFFKNIGFKETCKFIFKSFFRKKI